MVLKGKAHKFGDDVNTDYIIPSQYKAKTKNIDDMRQYLMKEIAPDLVANIRDGDFLVAGKNFGCGSSREAAPLVIQASGIAAVIAISFGRIFFRNSINIGLHVIECDTDSIEDGDLLKLDFEHEILINEGKGITVKINPMPQFIKQILDERGILNYLENHELKIE
jgi:3-isopropylmalate/(R)-2-methylmalate dehydratase small subunit